MDLFQTYAWIIWLALILIFVILEVITVDFSSLMFAAGSAAGLVSSLFSTIVPFWLQVIIAALVALLLLFAVRPPLKRLLQRGGDRTRSNVDALLGQRGIVTLDFNGKPNLVKLANGEPWTYKLSDSHHSALKEGDRVVVTDINGATAIVTPAERTTK